MHAWHDCGYESEEANQLLLDNGTSFEVKYCVAAASIIDDNSDVGIDDDDIVDVNDDDNDADNDDDNDADDDADAVGGIGDDDGDDIIVVVVVVVIGVVVIGVEVVGVEVVGVEVVEVVGVVVVVVGTKETNFDKFINISEILFTVVDKLFKVVDWLLAVFKSDLCIANNSLKVMEFISTKSSSFSSWFIFIIRKKKSFLFEKCYEDVKKKGFFLSVVTKKR